jgi:hypothetical protein
MKSDNDDVDDDDDGCKILFLRPKNKFHSLFLYFWHFDSFREITFSLRPRFESFSLFKTKRNEKHFEEKENKKK